jgi:hypothetical protein
MVARVPVPVWFGGESGPALKRVAEYGNGWCGFNLTPDEAAAKLKRIDELLKAAGRKRSDLYLAVPHLDIEGNETFGPGYPGRGSSNRLPASKRPECLNLQ